MQYACTAIKCSIVVNYTPCIPKFVCLYACVWVCVHVFLCTQLVYSRVHQPHARWRFKVSQFQLEFTFCRLPACLRSHRVQRGALTTIIADN